MLTFAMTTLFKKYMSIKCPYKVLNISVFHWQLLITYIFSVSLKFQACYITGQWGEFTVKNATFYLDKLSWHSFCCFQQTCVFIIFISFFDEASNLLNRILTN